MFAGGGQGEGLRDCGKVESKVQETGARDFHFLAQVGDLELRQDVDGQLAWVEFAGLGQGHERGALVITELWVRARPDENGRPFCIRQHGMNRLLQALFDLFVGQHGFPLKREAVETALPQHAFTFQRFSVSLFALFLDGFEHGLGVGRLVQGLAEFGLVQQLGDVGQRVQVLLKLALRHEEEHHQIHRLIVQRVEIAAFAGAAQRADDFGDQIGGGMRNSDSEANAGAHLRVALLDHGSDGLAVLGFDSSRSDEVADQFVNRFPTGGGLQIREDLIFRQNVSQVHRQSVEAFRLKLPPFSRENAESVERRRTRCWIRMAETARKRPPH